MRLRILYQPIIAILQNTASRAFDAELHEAQSQADEFRKMKPDRIERFNELLRFGERYRRKNQYLNKEVFVAHDVKDSDTITIISGV